MNKTVTKQEQLDALYQESQKIDLEMRDIFSQKGISTPSLLSLSKEDQNKWDELKKQFDAISTKIRELRYSHSVEQEIKIGDKVNVSAACTGIGKEMIGYVSGIDCILGNILVNVDYITPDPLGNIGKSAYIAHVKKIN